jgi:hypothetical protein
MPFMNYLQEVAIGCPYCGESITILVDGSIGEQGYIEDCEVCCRPIDLLITLTSKDDLRVEARSENDV